MTSPTLFKISSSTLFVWNKRADGGNVLQQFEELKDFWQSLFLSLETTKQDSISQYFLTLSEAFTPKAFVTAEEVQLWYQVINVAFKG